MAQSRACYEVFDAKTTSAEVLNELVRLRAELTTSKYEPAVARTLYAEFTQKFRQAQRDGVDLSRFNTLTETVSAREIQDERTRSKKVERPPLEADITKWFITYDFEVPKYVTVLKLSPDAKYLLYSTGHESLQLKNLETATVVRNLRFPNRINAADVNWETMTVMVATRPMHPRIDVVSLADGETKWHAGNKIATLNPTADEIALPDLNKLRIYDVTTRKLLREFDVAWPSDQVRTISYLADGERVQTLFESHMIVVNTKSGAVTTHPIENYRTTAMASNNSLIASVARSGQVQVGDLFLGSPYPYVSGLKFGPSDKTLAVFLGSKGVDLYSLSDGSLLRHIDDAVEAWTVSLTQYGLAYETKAAEKHLVKVLTSRTP